MGDEVGELLQAPITPSVQASRLTANQREYEPGIILKGAMQGIQ